MNVFKKNLWLFLLLSSTPLLATNEWQLVTDKKGVKIYQQQLPGRPFKHTKGVVTVKAKAPMVFALLNDLAVCEQWIYGCIDIKRQADDSIYMVFKGPPLFKDREVVLQSQVQYLRDSGQWLITVENMLHGVVNQDHVMVSSMQAKWLLTPKPNNEITIEHIFYIDPNVKVKFGANRYNSRAIYKTLLAMSEMLSKPKYQAQKQLPKFIRKLKN